MPNIRAIPKRSAVYSVAAAGAPGWARQAADAVCDGTDDQVEIQAAVDALAAAGGGTVQLSSGTFNVHKPPGATDVEGTCTITKSGTTTVLSALSFGTGALGDVAVGQLYRFSGGNDGSGKTLDDNKEAFVATVSAISPSIVVDQYTAAASYTGVTFTRLIGAIQLKSDVVLEGSGIYATRVKLAADQNCDLLHYEGDAVEVFARLALLSLDGNRANQGDHVQTTFDGRCNGVVINSYLYDLHVDTVEVVTCKGDGWWINNPWGLHLARGWTEYNSGNGIVLGKGGAGAITDHKLADNLSNALYLRYSDSALIEQTLLNAGTNGGYAVFNPVSNGVSIKGCLIYAYHTGNEGGIYQGGIRGLITGNQFIVYSISKPALILLNRDNVITGNTFQFNCYLPIDNSSDYAGMNTIVGNNLTHPDDETHVFWAQNTSGSQIALRSLVKRNTAANTIAATTGTSDRPLGQTHYAAIADTAWGRVQTLGRSNKFPYVDAAALAVGDRLAPSATVGAAQKAQSGQWVIAIAEQTTDGGGGTEYIQATLVQPYLEP